MKFIKFPSIEQYRNIVKKINDKSNFSGLDNDGKPTFNLYANKPTIKFIQTVKIHGTNAGITLTKNGEYGQQSRNRIITVDNDNYGFALWCNDQERKDYITRFLQTFLDRDERVRQVTIYGEYAGQGVFETVAIGKIPKSFYAFSLTLSYTDDKTWTLPLESLKGFISEELNLFNILMFDHKEVNIDFNNPDLAINDIILDTNLVEKECPVGKYFGVSGVGEGVVLVSEWGEYIFKSKGDKHSVSKVKSLSKVDVDMQNNIEEFVNRVVTVNRLEQGLEYLKEMQMELSPKSTGSYIKWVTEDVKKEELDTILANQLDFKVLQHQIGKVSKGYFFSYLDRQVGL